MNDAETEIRRSSFFGSLAILMGFVAILFLPSHQLFFFGISTFCGFLLCRLDDSKGLTLALFMTLAAAGYQLYIDPSWSVAIFSVSISLSLIVCSLSHSEILAIMNFVTERRVTTFTSKENELTQKLANALDQTLKKDAIILEHLDKINDLNADHQKAQLHIQATKEEITTKTNALEQSLAKISAHEQELLAKESIINAHARTIKSAQDKVESLNTEISQIRKDGAEYQTKLAENLALKEAIKQKDLELHSVTTELKDTLNRLSDVEAKFLALQRSSQLEMQHLQDQHTVIQQEKEEALGKIKSLTIDFEQISQNMIASERAERRNAGLYKQLKGQFIEKSQLLDETRRELFLAREEIEAHKRNSHIETPDQHDLDRYIVRLDSELDAVSKDYQKEIDGLHDLIATLSTRV